MAVRYSNSGQGHIRALSLGSISQFTVSCWIRMVASRNNWTCIWEIENGTSSLVQFASAIDGNNYTIADSTSTADATSGVQEALTVNEWKWFGVNWNGTSGNWSFKTLTSGITTETWTGMSLSSVSAANLRIGHSIFTDASNEWFNGNISGFKIWTGANLTAAELALEAAQTTPIRTSNIRAFYPFTRTETTDYSGQAQTLSGGTGSTTEDGPGVPWNRGRSRVFLPASVAGTEHTANLSDTLTLSDSLTREADFIREITDIETLADSITKASELSFTDAIVLSDSISSDLVDGETPLGQFTAVDNAVTTSAANSIACTIPNDGSVVVGDLLIWSGVIPSGSRTFTVTGVSNFTFAGSASQSGHGSHMWYKIAEAGDLGATVTLTPSTGAVKMVMLLGKISGADQTNPFDSPAKIASNTNVSGTTNITPSVTGVAAGSREISFVCDSRGTTSPNTASWTPPSGITSRDSAFTADDASNQRSSAAWGDSDATVSGTVGTRSWTADQPAVGSAWTFAVNPAIADTPEDHEDAESDVLSLSDTLSKDINKVLSDSMGLSDSLSVTNGLSVVISDSMGLSDTLSRLSTFNLTIQDIESLSDSLDVLETSPSDFEGTISVSPLELKWSVEHAEKNTTFGTLERKWDIQSD